jgi:hypothetical protein
MRTNPLRSTAIIWSLACLVLSGCLDITTTSEIRSDGSIVRTITFTGDSAEVYRGAFPVALDSSWIRAISRMDDKKVTLTASRTFHDVNEMNRAVEGSFGKTLQYRISLDKSFQWFFTVYRYEETNRPFAQFTSIPMSDFLTQDEIEWFKSKVLVEEASRGSMTHEDSVKFARISPLGEEWSLRNRFEAFFTAFLVGVESLHDNSLTQPMVLELKDSLYRHCARPIDSGKFDTLQTIFRGILKNRAVDRAWQASNSSFEVVEHKLEFEQSVGSHKYVTSVIMPGIITGSNARKIEGNAATWNDFVGVSAYFDYTMWVESRQVNWWAVGIAGIVVAALLVLLILSLLRRRVRI